MCSSDRFREQQSVRVFWGKYVLVGSLWNWVISSWSGDLTRVFGCSRWFLLCSSFFFLRHAFGSYHLMCLKHTSIDAQIHTLHFERRLPCPVHLGSGVGTRLRPVGRSVIHIHAPSPSCTPHTSPSDRVSRGIFTYCTDFLQLGSKKVISTCKIYSPFLSRLTLSTAGAPLLCQTLCWTHHVLAQRLREREADAW